MVDRTTPVKVKLHDITFCSADKFSHPSCEVTLVPPKGGTFSLKGKLKQLYFEIPFAISVKTHVLILEWASFLKLYCFVSPVLFTTNFLVFSYIRMISLDLVILGDRCI